MSESGGIVVIPRNSKDLVLKHLALALGGHALNAFGVARQAEVKQVLPTELASVDLRTDFLDFVLEMSDQTILHMEFQSKEEKTLHRFLLYDARLHQQLMRSVRTVVLYTSGVRHAPSILDIGTAVYHVENIFLIERDGNAVLRRIETHLDDGRWDPEDRIELAFAMHMRHQGATRKQILRRCLDAVDRITDRIERSYVIALFLGMSSKRLKENELKEIEERMENMFQAMVDAVEKRLVQIDARLAEAAEKAWAEGRGEGEEKGIEQGIEQGRLQEKLELAKRLLEMGDGVEKVSKVTGLSLEDIQHLLAK